ncbi:hypothetical protein F5Y17DRAFT_459008 [Xylariaceae sp. FL0594]|nr:hypothetical protein F5Y17DRAFT_459008 [Xylariaceae sp. FL0594]
MSRTPGAFPPLTTIFTPPPECHGVYASCSKNSSFTNVYDCVPRLFPDSVCVSNGSGGRSMQGCYPSYSTASAAPSASSSPIFTYEPGVNCPAGMTPAAAEDGASGVYCCPSRLGLAAGDNGLCTGSFGSEVITYLREDCDLDLFAFANTPDGPGLAGVDGMLLSFNNASILYGRGIFLEGATANVGVALVTSVSTTTAPTVSNNPGNGTSENGRSGMRAPVVGLSQAARIAIGLGVVLGIIHLVGLGLFLLRRYRKKRLGLKSLKCDSKPSCKISPCRARRSSYRGKAELQGTVPSFEPKPELDPSATRAELEGSPGEERGAGIYVLKPELEGTQSGRGGNVLVYVKVKSELEAGGASSRTTWRRFAEVEDSYGALV